VAIPPKVTDRKPGKLDKDTPELTFVKTDVMQRMAAAGHLACSWQDDVGATVGVPLEALAPMSTAGEC
jgi:hypothetical protein